MTRPTLEVADILRAQGDRFLERYRSSFGFQQLKAFRAILRCRTAALGGHRDACLRCGYQTISYNSCRNRHCPKCQAQARERWLTARPRDPFFLPVKVLSRLFRGKFLAGLQRLHRRNRLCCVGPAAALANRQQFSKLLRRLHRHDWVVYAKPAFGGPMQVLRYLGRYTHRVAISNHRLLAFDQELVTFRWKDYAHGGKQGKMTLLATEFLRRFFLHVLPRGFVRIRHFGFLANRFRASRLALSQQLLSSNSTPPAEVVICANSSQTSPLWHCPRCGAAMIVMQRFTAAELSTCSYFDSSYRVH